MPTTYSWELRERRPAPSTAGSIAASPQARKSGRFDRRFATSAEKTLTLPKGVISHGRRGAEVFASFSLTTYLLSLHKIDTRDVRASRRRHDALVPRGVVRDLTPRRERALLARLRRGWRG